MYLLNVVECSRFTRLNGVKKRGLNIGEHFLDMYIQVLNNFIGFVPTVHLQKCLRVFGDGAEELFETGFDRGVVLIIALRDDIIHENGCLGEECVVALLQNMMDLFLGG